MIQKIVKAIVAVGAIVVLMQLKAQCQTTGKADVLQMYREGDYGNLLTSNWVPVYNIGYEKLAKHTVKSTQVLIYQLILNGNIKAYSDENCNTPMTIAQWEEVIGKKDQDMITILAPNEIDLIDTFIYRPFLPDEVGEWSYFGIKGNNNAPKIKRKKSKDKRPTGTHISPWVGNVSIGLKPHRPMEVGGVIISDGSNRPSYFFVRARDVYKHLSETDVTVIEEFSYFHAETRTTADQLYISPKILKEWSDSMELQLRRTLWKGNMEGKLSSYKADSMHLERPLPEIIKAHQYMMPVYNEEADVTYQARDWTMGELRLHAEQQPAKWKGNFVSRYVSHIGFSVYEEDLEGMTRTYPISNTPIKELRKVLTDKEINFLMLAITFSSRKE